MNKKQSIGIAFIGLGLWMMLFLIWTAVLGFADKTLFSVFVGWILSGGLVGFGSYLLVTGW